MHRPGTGQRSSHHGCTTAASAAVWCKISGVSESQQLGKPIRLVKVRATRKDRAQHSEGTRLKFSERNEWKENGPNRQEGKEKQSIDRKRVFAGKEEGRYNGKEEGSFKEEGKQSVRQGGLSKAVRKLIRRGVNWEDEWEEEEGLMVGELGKRIAAEGGGRGGSDEGKEGN